MPIATFHMSFCTHERCVVVVNVSRKCLSGDVRPIEVARVISASNHAFKVCSF